MKPIDTNKIPNVGQYVRGEGVLVAVESVTPEPPPIETHYIFESINARVEARVGGKVIKEFSTFNDFYGQGTAVQSAIKAAKHLAKEDFGKTIGVEVVVVKMVCRRRRTVHHGDNLYAPKFCAFTWISQAYGNYGSQKGLPDDTEEVVWSSLKGQA